MSTKRKKLVMGFGTFDGLHPGHLFYLRELKKLGERLVIVIARDMNVKKIKGEAALFDEESRLKAVEKMAVADEVVLGSHSDFYEVIRKFKPDILGFGYDQHVDIEKLKANFPEIEMRRIGDYHPEKYKSTLIKQGLAGGIG